MEKGLQQDQKVKEVDILLNFVQETKGGKFTSQVPSIANIAYHRLEIQEQEFTRDGNTSNELILFGIS